MKRKETGVRYPAEKMTDISGIEKGDTSGRAAISEKPLLMTEKIKIQRNELGGCFVSSVHRHHLGDKGVQFIRDTLTANKTQPRIDLSGNNIGDEGVRYLSDALAENQSLQCIDLSGNNIGDEGAKYLRDTLKDNKTPQRIDLSGNNIGQETLRHWNRTVRASELKDNPGCSDPTRAQLPGLCKRRKQGKHQSRVLSAEISGQICDLPAEDAKSSNMQLLRKLVGNWLSEDDSGASYMPCFLSPSKGMMGQQPGLLFMERVLGSSVTSCLDANLPFHSMKRELHTLFCDNETRALIIETKRGEIGLIPLTAPEENTIAKFLSGFSHDPSKQIWIYAIRENIDHALQWAAALGLLWRRKHIRNDINVDLLEVATMLNTQSWISSLLTGLNKGLKADGHAEALATYQEMIQQLSGDSKASPVATIHPNTMDVYGYWSTNEAANSILSRLFDVKSVVKYGALVGEYTDVLSGSLTTVADFVGRLQARGERFMLLQLLRSVSFQGSHDDPFRKCTMDIESWFGSSCSSWLSKLRNCWDQFVASDLPVPEQHARMALKGHVSESLLGTPVRSCEDLVNFVNGVNEGRWKDINVKQVLGDSSWKSLCSHCKLISSYDDAISFFMKLLACLQGGMHQKLVQDTFHYFEMLFQACITNPHLYGSARIALTPFPHVAWLFLWRYGLLRAIPVPSTDSDDSCPLRVTELLKLYYLYVVRKDYPERHIHHWELMFVLCMKFLKEDPDLLPSNLSELHDRAII